MAVNYDELLSLLSPDGGMQANTRLKTQRLRAGDPTHRNNALVQALRNKYKLGEDVGDISQTDLEAADQSMQDTGLDELERTLGLKQQYSGPGAGEQAYELKKAAVAPTVTGEYGLGREQVAQTGLQKRQELENEGELAVAKASAAGQQGGGTIPASLMERTASSASSLDLLGELEKSFKDEYVGPAAGRFNTLLQHVPLIPTDKGFAEFQSKNAALKNAIIKAITGAQMSEPEAKRIMEQIPTLTDKPDVWHARAASTREQLMQLLDRIQQTTGNTRLRGQLNQMQMGDDDVIADENWGR